MKGLGLYYIATRTLWVWEAAKPQDRAKTDAGETRRQAVYLARIGFGNRIMQKKRYEMATLILGKHRSMPICIYVYMLMATVHRIRNRLKSERRHATSMCVAVPDGCRHRKGYEQRYYVNCFDQPEWIQHLPGKKMKVRCLGCKR